MASSSEGILLIYGSPLLDIIIRHPSAGELLDKYGLKANNSIFAEEKHLPLYTELQEKYSQLAQYEAGGTALNAARVVQWIAQTPRLTSFFGGIGRDQNGEILQTKTASASVNAVFQFTDSMVTGTCVTICTGDNRSMVSQQAAANCFTEVHLDIPEHWNLVEKARFFYTVSFSLATSPGVMFRLAHHAVERKKTFCLNLSAPFLCSKYKDSMSRLFPYVDIVFGNEAEADEFGKVHDVVSILHESQYQKEMAKDRKATAQAIAAWPKQTDRPRVVIITQGPGPVIVATADRVMEFPVHSMAEDEIVDSSGAGDAFVGGFLAQLTQQQPVEECVRCGIYASSVVLKHPGCSFSHPSDYDSLVRIQAKT